MVIYECQKCNKQFKQKSHYINHTENKKYPCDNTPYNVVNNKIHNNDIHNNESNIKDDVIINKKTTKNKIIIIDDTNNIINDDSNNDETAKLKNNFVCKHCDKEYSRNDSLNRHINNYCKSKKKTEEFNKLKQKYEDLLFKYEEILKTKGIINSNNSINSNNTMNNSHNTNLTNTSNITIYQFGKEDYSKITNNDILKSIMSSTGVGIPVALIEKMHFNNEYPEFKNVCITDINRKHALLWNGKKWLRKKYEKLGTEMLDRCLCLISDRMDELEELVADKKTFGIKKKTIDKLEDIEDEDDYDSDSDTQKSNIEDRKNFRIFASNKIEESLYNNKDVIYELTK